MRLPERRVSPIAYADFLAALQAAGSGELLPEEVRHLASSVGLVIREGDEPEGEGGEQ